MESVSRATNEPIAAARGASGSRLGDLLLRQGLVRGEDLVAAQARVRDGGGAITTALVATAGLSEERLVEFLRQEYRLPVVDPAEIEVPPDVTSVLHEIMQPPVKLKNAITSRIKVMSSLDISERRMPQDGRIKVRISAGEIDLRVSTLPTLFGEKVVLRILDKTATHMDIDRIGFSAPAIKTFRGAIHKPHGMILVTGPTGSGKTTTLYAALSELNGVETNISTAEDPVEYNLVGINQVQMHDDIGLNFATALRAFLRQDPDVIMVGEIRDFETAEIAVKAALTGHLVLSTVHTNDAPSTVNRLLNMGIEPFLIGSSVNLILAQRLARLNCSKCSQPVEIPAEVLIDLGVPAEQATPMIGKKGAGCPNCSGTGFRGRCALYELMPMSDLLREMVLAGASATELKQQAIKEGMETLRQSGIDKIRAGTTTPEEILRVTISD